MELYARTGNLVLRPAKAEDADRIARWKDDAHMRKMSIGEDVPITVEREKKDIIRALEEALPYWIIVHKEKERPIGYVRGDYMDEDRHMVWLRFGLGERRGEGHAKEALHAVIGHLFQRGVRRLEAEVYAFNIPCVRLLESLGFRREGVKRKAHYDKEGAHDVFVYGLLATDTHGEDAH